MMNMKQELYYWFKQYEWDISATLTFPDAYSAKQALKAAGKFWREVDYGLYGNASRRFNKRVQRVVMLEGDGVAQHHHLHSAILRPNDRFDTNEEFCCYLEKRWMKQNPRSVVFEFKPAWQANGWSRYITKEVSRVDCDSFDVHSSHIAAPNLQTASRANAST